MYSVILSKLNLAKTLHTLHHCFPMIEPKDVMQALAKALAFKDMPAAHDFIASIPSNEIRFRYFDTGIFVSHLYFSGYSHRKYQKELVHLFDDSAILDFDPRSVHSFCVRAGGLFWNGYCGNDYLIADGSPDEVLQACRNILRCLKSRRVKTFRARKLCTLKSIVSSHLAAPISDGIFVQAIVEIGLPFKPIRDQPDIDVYFNARMLRKAIEKYNFRYRADGLELDDSI